MTVAESCRGIRAAGKRAAGRLARRLLPNRTVSLSHVEPGLRLTVDLRRNLMFWWGGLARFEPYSVAASRAAIRAGDDIIDVGGNVGFFTTLFARLVGPDGRVVAFEPDPDNLRLLRGNVDALTSTDGKVEIVPAAVASKPGILDFSFDRATGATGHLGDTVTMGGELYGGGGSEVRPIAVETIDAVASRLGVSPALIKLDIEGGEFDALAGASETLSKFHPVVISELGGERGKDVIPFLADLHYEIWNIESGQPVPSRDPAPAMIIAVHRSELDAERGRNIRNAMEQSRT